MLHVPRRPGLCRMDSLILEAPTFISHSRLFPLHPKALGSRSMKSTFARLYCRGLSLRQRSVSQPPLPVKAIARTTDAVGHQREISDIRKRREKIIARLDSECGMGPGLREWMST